MFPIIIFDFSNISLRQKDRSGPFKATGWDDGMVRAFIGSENCLEVIGQSMVTQETNALTRLTDSSANQLYVASAPAILDSFGDETAKRAFECQYIQTHYPLNVHPVVGLDDGARIERSVAALCHVWATESPGGASLRMTWTHIGSRGAFRDLDMARSGLCMYLAPFLGAFQVCVPDIEPLLTDKRASENGWANMEPGEAKYWKVFRVQEGHEL